MDSNETLSKPIKQLSTSEGQGFDYTSLSPTTQIFVQQHTNEIKSMMRRTTQGVINIGQKLLEVKEHLGHGHFEVWLRAEFNWGLWTARKLMQVTRQFKSVNFTDLSIDASALYFLAAPSTPEAVRQEALKRAGQGEAITHAKVKAIASRYGKSAKPEPSKSLTIDIAAESLECGAFTLAETRLAEQTVNAKIAVDVEQFKDKRPEEKTEEPANFQVIDHSHDMVLATHSGDYPTKEQLKIDIQSLFEVGHFLHITKFGQQDYKWLGEIAEVKEASATGIEVVIKISLQPLTN